MQWSQTILCPHLPLILPRPRSPPVTHCSRHAGLPTILPTYQALFGLQHWLIPLPGRFFPKRSTSFNSPPPSGLCSKVTLSIRTPGSVYLKTPLPPHPSQFLHISAQFPPHSPYHLLKIIEFIYLLYQHPLLPATRPASITVSSVLCICLEIIHTEIG